MSRVISKFKSLYIYVRPRTEPVNGLRHKGVETVDGLETSYARLRLGAREPTPKVVTLVSPPDGARNNDVTDRGNGYKKA